MKNLPVVLIAAFTKSLELASVDQRLRSDYMKWLRYYLDFCFKYQHPPRDPDSLMPFMQKLASKNQTGVQQEQAAASVKLYYQTMKNWDQPHGGAGSSVAVPDPWEDLFTRLKEEIRIRQYSPKTLQTYRSWTAHFKKFLDGKPPNEITAEDARRFLTHLATEQRVVSTTQNQALNALLFVYRHILNVDYDLGDTVVRARRTRYIPVVMTREEVDEVIQQLEYPYNLAVRLLYGCGLRLFELLNLRIGCINFGEMIVTVHDGKGKKDRTVPLPERIVPDLKKHIEQISQLYDRDLQNGYDGVFMPGALDRKWKGASKEWVWQWVFRAQAVTFVPDTSEYRLYHLHETQLQKALREAVRKTRIPKRITAHTFRHSFASHLLRNNYDIRTIQEMLGHSDVRTTMIYTHTVKSRTQKERKSPLDF